MDFELPEEHQLAYESAFAFARDEIRPHNDEIESTDDFPRWMWQRLADQGYTGIAIPEEYGARGGYLLNGTKMFITNGPIADVIIVYAKTKPEAGSRGITAFIFETSTPGYYVARKLQKVGMRGSPTGELVFEDAFVPEENVLGRVNEGFKVVMSGLDLERAFFAVSAIGGLEAALEVSIKYAQEREQFGQPIANFQLIQAKIADMYTDLEAARHMSHRALWLAQQGKRVSKEAAAALLFTARAAMRAADEALQIHGGWGYLTDFEVERI